MVSRASKYFTRAIALFAIAALVMSPMDASATVADRVKLAKGSESGEVSEMTPL